MGFLKSAKFYFKSTLCLLVAAVFSLYAVVVSLAVKLVGRGDLGQYYVGRSFCFVFSKLLGITVKINNEKYLYDKPGVFISNHQSAMDLVPLGRLFQPGFTVTAKKALKYTPFLGWFLVASGTFFIDRQNSSKARNVLDKALATLKTQKRGVFLFPEGTRSCSQELDLSPFKKGAFHLAHQGKIPIVPIVFSNHSRIFHAKSKTFNSGQIIIDVLPPIETKDIETKQELDELVQKVRGLMLARLQEIGYGDDIPADTASDVRTDVQKSANKTVRKDANGDAVKDEITENVEEIPQNDSTEN